MTGVGHVVLTFSLEGCRGWIYLACCLQGPLPPQPSPNPQTTPDLWCRCPTNPKLSAATPYTKFIHNVPMNKENRRSCFQQLKYLNIYIYIWRVDSHSFVVFLITRLKKERKQLSSSFCVFSFEKFVTPWWNYRVDTSIKSFRLQILSRGWNEKRISINIG